MIEDNNSFIFAGDSEMKKLLACFANDDELAQFQGDFCQLINLTLQNHNSKISDDFKLMNEIFFVSYFCMKNIECILNLVKNIDFKKLTQDQLKEIT